MLPVGGEGRERGERRQRSVRSRGRRGGEMTIPSRPSPAASFSVYVYASFFRQWNSPLNRNKSSIVRFNSSSFSLLGVAFHARIFVRAAIISDPASNRTRKTHRAIVYLTDSTSSSISVSSLLATRANTAAGGGGKHVLSHSS